MDERRWKAVENLELSEIDDGFIIYDESRDRVHHLNHTAALVFILADGTCDAAGISKLVQEQFKMSEPPVRDVEAILQNFAAEGLISQC